MALAAAVFFPSCPSFSQILPLRMCHPRHLNSYAYATLFIYHQSGDNLE